jgi:hypothetical protein
MIDGDAGMLRKSGREGALCFSHASLIVCLNSFLPERLDDLFTNETIFSASH